MSGARRGRYAWAFLTRHFTRRLDSDRDGRPPFEATVIFVDPRSSRAAGLRGLSVGRSTEMVPAVEYDLTTQVAVPDTSDEISLSSVSDAGGEGDTHVQTSDRPPTSQRQQTIDILSGRARRVGSEIADLMPFWGNEEEPALGDDPTFQQLLCLAGVFCGPLMYLIGGILFCVIPREHRQTRRWALFNLVLAICSFVYLASTGSIEDMQRPVAGIHMLDGSDHLPLLDPASAQIGGLREAQLNLTGTRLLMDFTKDDWQQSWRSDSEAFTRINLDSELQLDSAAHGNIWVFGPTGTSEQTATLSTNNAMHMSQHVYIRSSLVTDRPLQSPLHTSPIRFLDCAALLQDGSCKGAAEAPNDKDELVKAELRCLRPEAMQNNTQLVVPLWGRQVDITVSPSGSIRPYVEDVVVNFGEQDLWCQTSYMLRSAPAHVYLNSQLVFT
eukprot:Gregarina_sp_Pseudo_9__5526@NODE_723_length_2313_cov_17_384785_g679_i0_p1_GENE_NODE_723_length_2313_cov_17_384785_g679_i0NODE_723_length_2313_cov_17_384785_g679_i0_p1_ORF_typecomplete_len441_score84_36Aa_trans/PF01490_18/0_22_NODE_723_length_2313_cov_17_384785_g679_i02281550